MADEKIQNDIIVGLGESEETEQTPSYDDFASLQGLIKSRFNKSEDARLFDENRWLRAYKNYRGIYGSDMSFTEKEKSRVFVKITKTKVLAAFGQLIEVLFSSGKFPIGVEPTHVPEGVAEFARVKQDNEPEKEAKTQEENVVDLYGYPGDGREITPGTTTTDLLRGLKDDYEGIDFASGPSPKSPEIPQIEPARQAAENLEKLIHDQLDETSAITVLRHVLFEMVLLGTGVLKGPFSHDKVLHKWDRNEEGEQEYRPQSKTVPKLEAVSVWDFYPDPDATSIEDCDYVIQRHSLNRSQLRDLGNRPLFRRSAIAECIKMGENYEVRGFETSLLDRENVDDLQKKRFEIYEYWGTMDSSLAKEAGLEVEEDFDELSEVQINAWVCNGHILRLVLNPFTPERLPFHVSPYEINPYQFFGVGIPENMEDAQMVMNGHARMAIDNLALAGNLVFDIDETQLVPGQDMSIYPGKIFRRQSGVTGTAINGLKFPNTATENLMMFDKFRQLADESTGIPSYSHGATGVQSTTRTAAGMSMLMGAAALSIKTVVKNIDDYLLRPLGESLFSWNMQFNQKIENIKGDIDIKARGTSSLMQKEVRSQRLMTFMQTANNPNIAPFVRWHSILKEIAKSLDIDPDQLINDPENAQIFAKIMGMTNGNQQTQGPSGGQQNVGAANGVPPGSNPTDTSGVGNGNIGTGNVPQPGEAGYAETSAAAPRSVNQG
tara:strand:- start:3679 stop:5835 length:2157 start_codon:yes stop_codon:yes gene_type:complete